MFASDFQRKLQKLNKHLRIRPNANPKFPAALYYDAGDSEVHICGVDTNDMPKFPVWEKQFMIKSGWLRPLKILVQKQLVDRRAVQKVFGVDLSYTQRLPAHRWVDPIQDALREARAQGEIVAQRKSNTEIAHVKDGKQVQYYNVDDLLQIHRMKKKAKGELS